MAFDEGLAQRVRRALAGRSDVEEKRMFGGLAFMLAGRMCCGVHHSELILRLPADEAKAALAMPQVQPFDLTGRPISGFVLVQEAGCARAADVVRWLAPAIRHALAGAPRPQRTANKPAKPARPRKCA